MKRLFMFYSSPKGLRNKFIISIALSAIIFFLNAIYFSMYTPAYEVSAELPGSNQDLSHADRGTARLAIVINSPGEESLELDGFLSINRHLTFSFKPFLTTSEANALSAHKHGFEVAVQIPFISDDKHLDNTRPNSIFPGMDRELTHRFVMDAFENIPYALGAVSDGNLIHDKELILNIFDVLKTKGYYFVYNNSLDSLNNIRYGKVPCFTEDVVINNCSTKEVIKSQLKKAGKAALENKYAIVSCNVCSHDIQSTADAISETLPWFDSKNIQLVYVSELIAGPRN